MSRIQVSKLKYIELINKAMQEQSRYASGMQVKAVPESVNPHGFVEVSGLPDAKGVMMIALAIVDKKYFYEPT